MEEKPIKQAIRYMMQSNNILLVTHEKMDGDGLGSGIALYLALSKLKKNVDFISLDEVPQALSFLPKTEVLSKEIPIGNDFVITLNCTQAEVDKIKYNKIGNKLNILVSPKRGIFTKEDVEFKRGQSKYDLIISLDAGDINQLGSLYKSNVDLFYSTVLLNIDHHISNDYFGKINLVDPLATSTAEIVLSLLDGLQSSIGKEVVLMDEDIATCLLTGITVDTNSFQNQNTSPKAFSVSAQLLGFGARQQEIIKHIYKTHHLSTLKLWGRALSNIKFDDETKIVWSVLSQADFVQSEASEEEVHGVIDELITSAPGAEIALLIREVGPGSFKASLRTLTNSVDANELAMMFQGGGHKRAAGFKISADDLQVAENMVIKKLYDSQYKRLNEESQVKSIELEEDKSVPIPQDPVTRAFVSKVKEASKVSGTVLAEEPSTKIQEPKVEDPSTKVQEPKVEDPSTKVQKPIINYQVLSTNYQDPGTKNREEQENNQEQKISLNVETKNEVVATEKDEKEIIQELEILTENVQENKFEEPQIIPIQKESTIGFAINRDNISTPVVIQEKDETEITEESKTTSSLSGGFSLKRENLAPKVAEVEDKAVTNESSEEKATNAGSFVLSREVSNPVVPVSNEEPKVESDKDSESNAVKESQKVEIPFAITLESPTNSSNIETNSAEAVKENIITQNTEVSNSTSPVLGQGDPNKASFTPGLNLKLK